MVKKVIRILIIIVAVLLMYKVDSYAWYSYAGKAYDEDYGTKYNDCGLLVENKTTGKKVKRFEEKTSAKNNKGFWMTNNGKEKINDSRVVDIYIYDDNICEGDVLHTIASYGMISDDENDWDNLDPDQDSHNEMRKE